jgi:hypothetical protein
VIYIYIYIYIYTCMYECMYVCMYIYTHTYVAHPSPFCTSSDTCPLNTPVGRERGSEGERERMRKWRGRDKEREGGRQEECVCIHLCLFKYHVCTSSTI